MEDKEEGRKQGGSAQSPAASPEARMSRARRRAWAALGRAAAACPADMRSAKVIGIAAMAVSRAVSPEAVDAAAAALTRAI